MFISYIEDWIKQAWTCWQYLVCPDVKRGIVLTIRMPTVELIQFDLRWRGGKEDASDSISHTRPLPRARANRVTNSKRLFIQLDLGNP